MIRDIMIDFSRLQGATVLVTGGAGFLGSHLTRKLLDFGANVIILDNFSTGKLVKISAVVPELTSVLESSFAIDLEKPLSEREKTYALNSTTYPEQTLTIIAGDACRKQDVDEVFERHSIRYVFHWAAVVGVKRTIENPLLVLRDLDGIRYVLDACVAKKIEKIVFSSSSEIYGDPLQLPEYEAGAVNAKMPYAVVKLMGELLLQTYQKEFGLRTTALRFFNVYGPRQESSEYGFVGAVFMQQALNKQAPTIFGDGSDTRDFVFVSDNVEASIRAMLSSEADGEVINIGTGRPTTVLDLAEKIINIAEVDVKPKFLPAREVEVHHRWPNIMKMRKLLDFYPKISIEEGLRIAINEARSSGEGKA